MESSAFMLVLACAVVVAGAGGIALFLNRDKIFRKPDSAGIPESNTAPEPDETAGNLTVISDGIRKYADDFNGLYESLYQAQANREFFSTDAYQEWCDRISQIDDAVLYSAFSQLFHKSDITEESVCREKFVQLLSCIEKAGIRRFGESGQECLVDETVAKAYFDMNGAPPKIGAKGTIVKPAWMNGQEAAETGMIMIQE